MSIIGKNLVLLSVSLLASGCLAGHVADSVSDGTKNVPATAPSTVNGTPTTAASARASIDLTVARAFIIQVQQHDDGSIPLIAGRDGYLRVFVTTESDQEPMLWLRARFFLNGENIYEQVVAPGPQAMPSTAPDSSDWLASWNLFVPGHVLAPGVSLVLDVDPAHATTGNNATVTLTATLPLNIVHVAPYNAVAVVISTPNASDATAPPVVGNLNANNVATYYQLALATLPVSDYTLTIRPGVFALNMVLQSDGGNWDAAVGDLQTAQYADPNGANAYWFGFAKLQYGGGVCGIDEEGGRVGLAEDDGLNGMLWAQQSVAHEEGHGFGLWHSPCGGAANVDPDWPTDTAHSGAQIGSWGLNVSQEGNLSPADGNQALLAPTDHDIMSYCSEDWFSDFSYLKALNHQTISSPAGQDAVPPQTKSTHLVIAGRVEDGSIAISHAVRAEGADMLPPAGAYRITGLGAAGDVLFSVPFEPQPIIARVHAGLQRPTRALSKFIMALPVSDQDTVSTLILHSPGKPDQRITRSRSSQRWAEQRRLVPNDNVLDLRAHGGKEANSVFITWNAQDYPKAFVKDALGHPLGVLRGGHGQVITPNVDLDVILTDGLDSITAHVVVH